MAKPLPKSMNADDFIAWAMEQPRGRFELVEGDVIAMAPERSLHALTKARFFRRLAEETERLGLDCTAYPDGMAVRVNDRVVYEPDAMLRCGPELDDNEIYVPDPLVVVEVRSHSTGSFDAGSKLSDYFRVPSVRHYLIVRAEEHVVIHHERRDDGEVCINLIRDGIVPLDPPGIVLRDLFPERRGRQP